LGFNLSQGLGRGLCHALGRGLGRHPGFKKAWANLGFGLGHILSICPGRSRVADWVKSWDVDRVAYQDAAWFVAWVVPRIPGEGVLLGP